MTNKSKPYVAIVHNITKLFNGELDWQIVQNKGVHHQQVFNLCKMSHCARFLQHSGGNRDFCLAVEVVYVSAKDFSSQ